MMDRTRDKSLLRAMAQEIGWAANALPTEPLTGFLAARGEAYQGELMWVGRAVNGWLKPGCTPAALQDESRIDALVQAVFDKALGLDEDGPCPLRWVANPWSGKKDDYNTARSAFWRTAKQVLAGLDPSAPADPTWSSRLVWSNLYKFAPEKGWNPGAKVIARQQALCRELLLHEIATFRPKRLVLATGLDWAKPFVSAPCFAVEAEPKGKYLDAYGALMLDGEPIGRFVVARHPMGKKEECWIKEVRKGLEGSALP
ncbi:hypothetical protein IC232_07870 [Microvirga sp. BT688]|uniref:hypothetical protein n=1 Tax=Microvirga sp. TaxID=1873136 RepID=UPI0016881D36|nr:hypothetical protein [Microvirga sp.]MBD2746617.1 hypothetical protein [Microvirga sp.]